ncbi:fimbrial protein [Escherichia albertii]|uniref:fimbrial protein n=1 Tax=Escherichia albertii TaxID=208962 RepID=UPI001A120AEA|nr:fimbrial protein [Escherichia albertii]MCU7297420.1 type 1 fimbrial protein [Escherichia albertii]MCU7306738.1 type 1 fimbrial protein [Escherichia albertii]MCZ8925868.1 fimbrial protein [Escherichia albertii]MCZ9155100.1 fimbrial protein [Escherichia albertii]MCZ9164496.1 fimbrial protein [Escherichia albertii]
MRYYSKSLYLLLFIATGAIGGDTVSQSVNMTFTVNVEPPVCKLNNADLSVDFEEFQVSDIVAGNVKKMAEFVFTDCVNVNNVTVSFTGDNIDSNNNLIKNKTGVNNASGVAIGLYDYNGSRIQLKDVQHISVNNADSFYFGVTAAVLKESSAAVTPGKIDTSVNLNITYN